MQKAQAIVVGGGNSFHLLHSFYQNELVEVTRARVNAGIPYLGWSAGSNLACPTIGTTNDMPIVEPASLRALDLVPFQINPHYTSERLADHKGESRDERIAEFLKVNPARAVIGLREGTALQREASVLSLLGNASAMLFRHGSEPIPLVAGEDLSFLLR